MKNILDELYDYDRKRQPHPRLAKSNRIRYNSSKGIPPGRS